MVTTEVIHRFTVKCDKCGDTLFVPCCGIYFYNESEVMRAIQEQGWTLTSNSGNCLCPDCKK